MTVGTFKVARSIWDHPAFKDEPLSEREAFMWMCGRASYRSRETRQGRTERGQLRCSVRFMAEAWKWSKSRVNRFLDRLKNRDMVETESGTGVLLITICNYNKFQGEDRVSGTRAGQQAGRERDSGGTNKNKDNKDNKVKPPTPFEVLCEILPSDLAKEFTDYRKDMGKPIRTRQAASGVVNNLKKLRDLGNDPSNAIRLAMSEGWLTIKPEYLKSYPVESGGGNARPNEQSAMLQFFRDRDANQRVAGGASDERAEPLLPGPDGCVSGNAGNDGLDCGFERVPEIGDRGGVHGMAQVIPLTANAR